MTGTYFLVPSCSLISDNFVFFSVCKQRDALEDAAPAGIPQPVTKTVAGKSNTLKDAALAGMPQLVTKTAAEKSNALEDAAPAGIPQLVTKTVAGKSSKGGKGSWVPANTISPK